MGRDMDESYFPTGYSTVVSTHTPAWGVTALWKCPMERLSRFYSHARMGRDDLLCSQCEWIEVSTHTPAWGVTKNSLDSITAVLVSTHTPAWGVTGIPLHIICQIKFLLTRPHGA